MAEIRERDNNRHLRHPQPWGFSDEVTHEDVRWLLKQLEQALAELEEERSTPADYREGKG